MGERASRGKGELQAVPVAGETVGCVWVLSGAPLPEVAPETRWVPGPDRVVVADGGQALAGMMGLSPDLVVGDMDSIEPSSLRELEAAGVPVERYEHNKKWETDTELAVLSALRWDPECVVILGALGGRLDHTLANILLLTNPALEGLTVSILDGAQEVFLARPGSWTSVRGEAGDTMSLMAVGGPVEGITLEGLEYPLAGETLMPGSGRGVSNRLVSDGGKVWLDRGQLLVVVGHTQQG